jgi:hypothetical protein
MDATAKVTAQLNLDPASAKKLKEASEAVFNAGYGEDFAGVSDTMKTLMGSVKGAKDMSAKELTALGKDFTNVTTGFEQDAATIGTAINAMVGTGLSGNATEALATLTAGFQELGPAGASFAEDMAEFGNDFASLGFDGAETVGLMKTALDAGFKSSDVFADSLNELQIKVGDFSADESLLALGLDPNTIRKDFAAGGDAAQGAFTDIIKKLQKSGDRNLWAGVFGTQSEDYFVNFNKMDLDKLTPANGDLAKLDKNLTTINSLVLSLQRTFESAFIKTLQPAIDYMAPKIAEFATYISENEDAAKALGAAIIGTLVVGVVLLTASLFALIIPILANPLVWVIVAWVAGLALVGFAIWQLVANWDKGTKAMAELWGGLMNWFGEIWGGFANWWNEMWAGFGGMMTDFGNNTVGMFEDMAAHIGNFFINIANSFIQMWNAMIEGLNSVKIEMPDWLGGGKWDGLNLPLTSQITPIPMKNGGIVHPQSGGVITQLAEAGRSEAVTDAVTLNENIAAQTALMNAMAAGGAGVTIKVYAQPGQSVQEIAEAIKNLDIFDATR